MHRSTPRSSAWTSTMSSSDHLMKPVKRFFPILLMLTLTVLSGCASAEKTNEQDKIQIQEIPQHPQIY